MTLYCTVLYCSKLHNTSCIVRCAMLFYPILLVQRLAFSKCPINGRHYNHLRSPGHLSIWLWSTSPRPSLWSPGSIQTPIRPCSHCFLHKTPLSPWLPCIWRSASSWMVGTVSFHPSVSWLAQLCALPLPQAWLPRLVLPAPSSPPRCPPDPGHTQNLRVSLFKWFPRTVTGKNLATIKRGWSYMS